MFADGFAGGNIVSVDGLGGSQQGFFDVVNATHGLAGGFQHPVDCPEQIDCRGTGFAQGLSDAF